MKHRAEMIVATRWMLISMVAMVVAACTTQQGKSVATAQSIDLTTTAIGLSQGLVEANPLGIALIPVKYGVTKYIDTRPCEEGVAIEKVTNSIIYGVSGWNLALITGLSPIIGIAVVSGGFLAYRLNKPIHCPTMKELVADNMAIIYGIPSETY